MNILEQIQNTEQQAVEIKRNAHAQSRDIVREGERKAKEATAKNLEAAEALAASKLKDAAALAEEQANQFLLSSTKKDDELLQKAEANIGAAVSYIVQSAEGMQ